MVLTVGVGLALTLRSVAAPRAPALAWVALGDSYAAGVGTGLATEPCARQTGAYPVQAQRLLEQEGWTVELDWRACTGHHVSDILARQVPAITPDTNLVTISAGGNDVRFVAQLVAALTGRTVADGVQPTTSGAVDWEELESELTELYTEARNRMDPRGHVLALTYPRLFAAPEAWPGRRCVGFSAAAATRLDEGVHRLAATIATAVRHADALVGNVHLVTWSSGDGALCGTQPPTMFGYHVGLWAPGHAANPATGSFHPTRLGHAAAATDIVAAIRAHVEHA
jgi:lysophospholipase L1-like esterase